MCMEDEGYERYCKGKSKNRRVEIDPMGQAPSLSPQTRAGLNEMVTGQQGNLPIGQGRALNQLLNVLDENGLPYPHFKLGPLA